MDDLNTLLNEVSQGNYENFRAYLSKNNIKHLDLSWGKIKNHNLTHFGNALKGTQVKSVDLRFNEIDDQGAKNFGEALKGTQVTHVNLCRNRIGPQGAKDFGEALKGTQVTHVELGWNRIGDQGAKDFGDALKGTQVTHVNLRCSNIGPQGVMHLGEALKAATQVISINLRSNDIGPQDEKDFAACISDTCLLHADLGSKPSSELLMALKLNNDILFISPYQLVALLQTYKGDLTLKRDALETPEGQFRYGLEISTHEKLPMDVGLEIISNLPLMKGRKGENIAWKYQDFLKKIQKQKEIESGMKKLKL